MDAENGTAAQIASCNYFLREPATAYQPWVEAMLRQYRVFSEFLKGSSLPASVHQKVRCRMAMSACDVAKLLSTHVSSAQCKKQRYGASDTTAWP